MTVARTEDENSAPLRMHHTLATPEDEKEFGYVAIISIENGVKTFTRIEATKLRDWLTGLLEKTS